MKKLLDPDGWAITLIQVIAWLLASAGSILDALYIREAVLNILRALQLVNQDAYRARGNVGIDLKFGFGIEAVNDVLLLVSGCAAIAFVVWADYYFRSGVKKGLFLKRLAKVFGIELGILFVAVLSLVLIY